MSSAPHARQATATAPAAASEGERDAMQFLLALGVFATGAILSVLYFLYRLFT